MSEKLECPYCHEVLINDEAFDNRLIAVHYSAYRQDLGLKP